MKSSLGRAHIELPKDLNEILTLASLSTATPAFPAGAPCLGMMDRGVPIVLRGRIAAGRAATHLVEMGEMMTPADREEMVARYRAWETEDLIRAVKIDSHGYTPEALALIAEELAARHDSVEQRHELEEVVAEKHDREVRRLTGVRGWLLVLVLVVARSSVASLVNSAKSIRQVPPEMQVFAFIAGAYGVLGLVTVGLLLSKHRRAPGFAVTLFLTAMAISLVEADGRRPEARWCNSTTWCSSLTTSE